MHARVLQVALYNTDQEGSDSPRSSLNNSLSDQSLASVNLNSVGSVHSYTPVRPLVTSSDHRGVELPTTDPWGGEVGGGGDGS